MSPRQSRRAKAAGVTVSRAPKRRARTTAEKVARVLARIEGGELVTAACRAEGTSHQRVLEWRDAAPANRARYVRAREQQAHAIAEQAIAIADDASGDVVLDAQGRERLNTEFVLRSRLRFDARKWYAAKVAPNLYGEKLDVTTDGKEFPAFVVRIERDA
jgi:hypothetical protein